MQMTHTSTIAALIAWLSITYLIAETVYERWRNRNSGSWGIAPLRVPERRRYSIMPACKIGTRRLQTCSPSYISRVRHAIGSMRTGLVKVEKNESQKQKPLTAEMKPIWILATFLLGAGGDGLRDDPEDDGPEIIARREAPQEGEPPIHDDAPGVLPVHVYYGDNIRYRYYMQQGARWASVIEHLANDLRVERDTVAVCHLWGGSIDRTEEITLPPSGSPRSVGYRIMQLPQVNLDTEPMVQGQRAQPQRERSRSREAESSDDSMRPHRRLVMFYQQGTTLQRLSVSAEEIGRPIGEVTPADIEEWIRREHANLVPEGARIGLMVGDSPTYGAAMRHQIPIPRTYWSWRSQVYVVRADTAGATLPVSEADHSAAVKTCAAALTGYMQKNQQRLLLRGEPSLVRRINKIGQAPQNVRDLMLAAARRYKMQVPDEKDEGKPKQTVVQKPKDTKSEVQTPDSAWQQVRSRSRKTKSDGAAVQSSDRSEHVPPKLTLFEEDWSHPIMTELQLAKDGVYLTANQKEAEALAPKLQKTRHAVALISIDRLPHASHSEEIVFRVRQTTKMQGKEQCRERILRGYLSNYGATWVKARMQVATLSCPQKKEASTTVVLMSSRRAAVPDSAWREIMKYTTVKGIREALRSQEPLPQAVVGGGFPRVVVCAFSAGFAQSTQKGRRTQPDRAMAGHSGTVDKFVTCNPPFRPQGHIPKKRSSRHCCGGHDAALLQAPTGNPHGCKGTCTPPQTKKKIKDSCGPSGKNCRAFGLRFGVCWPKVGLFFFNSGSLQWIGFSQWSSPEYILDLNGLFPASPARVLTSTMKNTLARKELDYISSDGALAALVSSFFLGGLLTLSCPAKAPASVSKTVHSGKGR